MIKIEKIEIIQIRLPLIHSFVTGFGTINEKDSIIVKIFSENIIGYGEGSSLRHPVYISEFTDESFRVLKKYLVKAVLGKTFYTPEEFVKSYSHVKGHNLAKTSLECAFLDLYTQKENKSLKEIFGGVRNEIEVGESIGIKNNINESLDEIGLRLSEGYKRIKLKIKPGFDIELVKAAREKFGDISLMVDANSSYTLNDVETFKKLDNFNLMMIEQPLGSDDIINHAVLQRKIKTPVCLDESILSVEDARKAISIGACKIINIKPGRVGGLIESKKIHDLCLENNIGVWCGGMLETGIGRYFNLVITSLSNFIYPADMSPSPMFFEGDLVKKPFMVENGKVQVPSDLRKDYEVSDELIQKYTIKKEVFHVKN